MDFRNDKNSDFLSMDEQERFKILHFLEDIHMKFANKQLSHKEEQEITEFFMNYSYNRYQNTNSNKKESENDDKKYIVLGWYIYNFLQKFNS